MKLRDSSINEWPFLYINWYCPSNDRLSILLSPAHSILRASFTLIASYNKRRLRWTKQITLVQREAPWHKKAKNLPFVAKSLLCIGRGLYPAIQFYNPVRYLIKSTIKSASTFEKIMYKENNIFWQNNIKSTSNIYTSVSYYLFWYETHIFS